MFNRNQLVHAVFWPQDMKEACISLIDADGVSQGSINVHDPVMGSDLARKVPEGYFLHAEHCTVVNMSGKLLIGRPAPFDTAVVTERPVVSDSDRLARLERIGLLQQQQHAALLEENRQLKAKQSAAQRQQEVVEPIEATPPPEAQETPPEAPDEKDGPSEA